MFSKISELPLQARDLLDFDPETMLALGLFFLIGLTFTIALQWIFKPRKKWRMRFTLLVGYCLLLSVWFYNNHIEQEKAKKLRWAWKMTCNHDYQAEDLFSEKIKHLESDSTALRLACAARERVYRNLNIDYDPSHWDSLENYIYNTYFKKTFPHYQCYFTFCGPKERLLVGNDLATVSCHAFFKDKADASVPCQVPGLYQTDYGLDFYSYLFRRPLSCGKDSIWINVELGRKRFTDIPGKVGMLIPPTLSYAYYNHSDLWSHSGDFMYPFLLQYPTRSDTVHFVDWRDYSHLYYPLEKGRVLLLSTPKEKTSDILYNFSLFFLVFGLMGAILLSLFDKDFFGMSRSYARRLTSSTFIAAMILFIIFGGTSILSIQQMTQNENAKVLYNQTLAILAEMESNYMNIPAQSLENKQQDVIEDIYQDIKNLANLFRTDIYLYATDGEMVCYSEQNSFIPRHLQTDIVTEIMEEQNHLLIRKENFGDKMTGLIAYTPFRNAANEILGFFCIPYFSQIEEVRSDVNNFLSIYLTIFAIVSILTIWLSLIMARRITRPLSIIATKVSQTRLTHKNEPLEWKGEDEIGTLVKQYNLMVEQLKKSTRQLAQSERENAWTEMARQVAHEIKNPLTPMKLQIQQLQRAYRDQKPDFGERLERVVSMLSEQIDRLADIAGTFSQLAKWQNPEMQSVDINQLLSKIHHLYSAMENYDLVLEPYPCQETPCHISADPKFLEQILHNLIKNAIQALESQENTGNHSKGQIRIGYRIPQTVYTSHTSYTSQMEREQEKEKTIEIYVCDNGPGIEIEKQETIFEPHFTTRNTGAGLGLAICKRMCESMDGEISVESTPGEGACFILKFQAAQAA